MVPSFLHSNSLVLAAHNVVGCSTGYMVDVRGDWNALVERAAETSSSAVELSALSEQELPGLLDYIAGAPRLPFNFISVHGPSKDRRMADRELVDQLGRLPAWVTAVVLHPDTMWDPAAYAPLGRRLVIENMDSRKDAGQTAEQLAPLFRLLPQARLCLDLAHAKAVDPSMDAAEELLTMFATRLSHVHLSSLDAGRSHIPLTIDDEALFARLLARCSDVPWILEAPPS